MSYFAGLDVSVKETSVCIVDDAGKIVREARVASEPEALLQVLTNTIYRFKRIGLEAGPLSQWLYSVAGAARRIYAHVSSFTHHPAARDWLDQQLNGSGPVGLPWPSIIAFLRLVTNPRIFEHPESIGDAWRQVHAWLACEAAWIPQPTERHAELLGEFLALPGMHGDLVPDAHLAALAVERGLTLCSTDGDFARFRGLRWLNPIPPS
jgi:uncharacterized protein